MVEERKSWRPSDWRNPYGLPKAVVSIGFQEAFEEGADAMQEEMLKLIARLGYSGVADDLKIFMGLVPYPPGASCT